ncbi:MAG: vWA domain-containing protein [Candidatus Binatia bacterium]
MSKQRVVVGWPRTVVAGAVSLAAALVAWAGSPGPNSTTIPSTQQTLSVAITQPPDNSQIPIPPGTVQVNGNCGIGSVPGQPINLLYVVDVSGSTDLNYMVQTGIPLVDADGNGTPGSPGDDFNGDGEKGDVLDGEVAGLIALHNSIGNPSNVRVGLVAFASAARRADVGPAAGAQNFLNPPLADANAANGPDMIEVIRSLDSDYTNPSGGQIKKFTLVSQGTLGSATRFDLALAEAHSTLLTFPQAGALNIVFFISDGESNAGYRCFQGACATQLANLAALGVRVNTVGVGAGADPTDLSYIAAQLGGTFVQVTNPSLLSTVLPSITPAGLDRVEVDNVVVPLDVLGNFTTTALCNGPGPLTVTAQCFASDNAHTNVSANVTLTCYNVCGNQQLDPGEECDPPNTPTCDGQCQRVPICGDHNVDAPETCDPPDGVSCSPTCQMIQCGDGVTQGQEECDPPSPGLCDGNCQRVPVCGDGFIDTPPETCEPPNTLTCYSDCTLIACGNGRVEPGEECEPSNPTPPCDQNCQRVPICGDGFLDTPEACDPPNQTNCTPQCQLSVCGNEVLEPGEECDGSAFGSFTCAPLPCQCGPSCVRTPVCGDGQVDGFEQCEPPNSSNCDGSCRLISCGNGIVQPGEECEPPNTNLCDASCQRVPLCGDTFVDFPPEQCEPPGTATCFTDCTLVACGNGRVEPLGGEECDPPNTATCDGNCQRVPNCGDSFIDAPEECEPPNSNNCDAACRLIACGNGLIQAGEECDPPTPGVCDAGCQRVPVCGDGHIDTPPEQCEPPNSTTCSATCQLKEDCGNQVDDDGDGLIDCKDSDCPPCPPPHKDPSTIKFDTSGHHRDLFTTHGRLPLVGAVDPRNEDLAIVLTRVDGTVIFRTTVPSGAITGVGTSYKFKDRTGARADGLVLVKLANHMGVWTYKAKAYANLSGATEPEMTLQIAVGSQTFSLNRRWRAKGYGWFLPND